MFKFSQYMILSEAMSVNDAMAGRFVRKHPEGEDVGKRLVSHYAKMDPEYNESDPGKKLKYLPTMLHWHKRQVTQGEDNIQRQLNNPTVGHLISAVNTIKKEGLKPDLLKPALQAHYRHAGRTEGVETDVNKKTFPTVTDFYNHIQKHPKHGDLTNKKPELSKSKRKAKLAKETETVHDDEDIRVQVPKTHWASCQLGKGTKWCTAQSKGHNPNHYFDRYSKQGPLHVVTLKNVPEDTNDKALSDLPGGPSSPEERLKQLGPKKLQFHFNSNTFADASDITHGIQSLVKRYPELQKVKAFKDQHPAFMSDDELKKAASGPASDATHNNLWQHGDDETRLTLAKNPHLSPNSQKRISKETPVNSHIWHALRQNPNLHKSAVYSLLRNADPMDSPGSADNATYELWKEHGHKIPKNSTPDLLRFGRLGIKTSKAILESDPSNRMITHAIKHENMDIGVQLTDHILKNHRDKLTGVHIKDIKARFPGGIMFNLGKHAHPDTVGKILRKRNVKPHEDFLAGLSSTSHKDHYGEPDNYGNRKPNKTWASNADLALSRHADKMDQRTKENMVRGLIDGEHHKLAKKHLHHDPEIKKYFEQQK
jgi:hypothetical protein